MADAGVMCDGCHLLVGSCVETLQCGHYLCDACSCRLELLDTICPLCERPETEDCEILSCSEDFTFEADCPVQLLEKERLSTPCVSRPRGKDMSLSVSSVDGSLSNSSVNTGMSLDDAVGSNIKQLESENDVKHAAVSEKTICVDFKDNLYEMIDEALVIANETFGDINTAMQTLKKLDTRNKLIEDSVSDLIQEEFEKLSLALRSRKSNLLQELRSVSEIYTSDIANAVKKIEEQKKCLKTRVEFAEALKRSPLLTVYCDLNQLVADLKVNFKNECMVDTLKDQPDMRFNINSNRIIKIIKNLGSICSYSALECQLTPDVNTLSTNTESFHLNIKPVHSSAVAHIAEYKAKGLNDEQYQTDLGHIIKVENQMQTNHQLCSDPKHVDLQKSSLSSLKNNALLQSLSSPDVIIEEIIEDDQPYLSEPQSNFTDSYHDKRAHFKRVPFTEFNNGKPKKFKKSVKRMGTTAPFVQRNISRELVYLSHVVNPCDFYVHHLTQKKQIIMLERMLITLSHTTNQCCSTDILEVGEIIAFKSTERNAWCRGCITELIPLESKWIGQPFGPTKYRIEDISRVTIFLLDYGSSEIFVVTRFAVAHFMNTDPITICQTRVNDLYNILIKLSSTEEEHLKLMPPFAIHCSLDIVPQSSDGLWAREIKDHILKVVNNKCVVLKVFREEEKTLIVDLKKPFTNKISSDMPVSLRDALVFLELAKFPSKVSTALNNVGVTQYKNPLLPKKMTEILVIVCHMNDPSDFYLHVIGESEYVRIVDKVQEVYNSEEADDLKILCPVMGQACVAKYNSEDDQWYRAEVIGIPNPQETVIKYVDFGNVVRVNTTKLRQLKEEFLVLPQKAICCRLACIQPINDAPRWSLEACNLFEELTSYKRLKCTSIGVLLDNKLSVELFHVNPSTETSINSLLVKENVASFIPRTPGSNDQHLPLKEIWDPVTDLLPDTVEKCMDAFSLFEQKELDVLISHVISPSKIFVQWLSTESILKSLQVNLFERYESSKPEEDVQWQVDMQVAVQLQIDKKWRRGQIKNIITDKLVEVFCYDFGMEEVTDVINLRTLDETLKIYGTMCLECSLMDIKPAGGCENWTATACDFLCYYLSGATATVIIEDNASHWPFPVRILIKNEAGQLVDVSDHLIRKGLALRDRRFKKHDSLMDVNETTKLADNADVSVQEVISAPVSESDKTVTGEENIVPISEDPVVETTIDEPYLSPPLPNEKTFVAKVSYVAEDGTIHVIQQSLENELGMLMLDIQNSFKCLGLMAPYSWKKGEGCLIKGSDTMSYRGKVLEILGGDMIKVQYEDFGYTEKIPKCHLYPCVFNPSIPRFSIPCQLSDLLHVGECWQPDAIQFLKELLLDRIVSVHVVEPPQGPRGIASVYLYCGNASVSAILEKYSHCIPKDCEKKKKDAGFDVNSDVASYTETHFPQKKNWEIDFQEVLQTELETPLLPKYSLPSLPRPGELFTVKVTHLQTPNLVFISIDNGAGKSILNASGDCNHNSDFYPVESSLKRINNEADTLPCVTDFRTEMPCLAYYNDGLLHRARLQSIKSYDPVTCLVEFVDYGSTAVVEAYNLFQLPAFLIQYPAKAIKVKLAGFKPPKEDFETDRVPYCLEWSFKALYDMIDLVQGKTLSATFVVSHLQMQLKWCE
ncbi:RING finger protein 17 isoform X2 [Mixophyes fleayi]|uniref:RING finger protein 17 isoform X2 n=1 Tax=Mixophyes fleayi TaxID=3061075 RepID=UPI003F4DF2E1